MRFGKKGKKAEEAQACEACRGNSPPDLKKMMAQRAKEMQAREKVREKEIVCPYLDGCDFKMLPEVGKIICLDLEGERGSPAWQAHMAGQHMWQQCRKYVEKVREEKGILPKDIKAFLKKQAKGK